MADTNKGDQPDSSMQAHSCMLCKQRKVKCDKQYPCSQCLRAKVQCIFRAPAPPRRGKRKPTEVNLLARLKRYEDMLQALGMTIDPEKPTGDVKSEETDVLKEGHGFGSHVLNPVGKGNKAERGKLVAGEEGKSIYVENMLWKSLSDELRDPTEILDPSSEEDEDDDDGSSPFSIDYNNSDLLLSPGRIPSNVRIQHPMPAQIQRLWQAFVSAVNPVCKVLHEPTTYAAILEASKDLHHVPKNLEALMCAIYAIGAFTMEAEEIEILFGGEKQAAIVERYSVATRVALSRAGLLRSTDFMLVQAFCIHLFLIRTSIDARILWIYTGICVRLAQRIGMHRDGTHLQCKPFDTEMRRRVWWQVVVLDTHAAQLSGAGSTLASESWDSLLPLNVNDDELYPDMTEFPEEHTGPTEMFFCMVRFEFGRVFRPIVNNDAKKDAKWGRDPNTRVWAVGPESMNMSIEEKDKRIDEAERRIGDLFLRYVDAFNDLHVMSLGVARTAIASMRLMVHHPRQYKDGGASLPAEEKEMLLQSAMRIMEYDCNAHASPNLRRFRWHYAAFFQASAFVYILSELSHRPTGPGSDAIWRLVGEVYRYHPEILNDQRRSVHVALGNLTLRAWRARETATGGPGPIPAYIETLRQRRASVSARSHSRSSGTSPGATGSGGPTPRSIPTQLTQPSPPPQPPLPTSLQSMQSSQSPPPLLQQQSQLKNMSPLQQQQQQQQALHHSLQTLDLSNPNPVVHANPLGKAPSSKPPPAMSNPYPFNYVFPTDGAIGTQPIQPPALDLGHDDIDMDWAAWDDLIADSRLEGYGLDGTMAPLGFGFGG